MTIELQQRNRIIALERANTELKVANAELQQRLNDLFGEYQILQYTIRQSPTAGDLITAQRRVKKLEQLLERKVPGWRFKLEKDGTENGAAKAATGG